MFLLAGAAQCNMESLGPVISAVKLVLIVIQYVVPVILIVFGSIDLIKAVIAGKEEDIKKNQQTLFKRIVAAVIVFLVPLIVKVVMGLIGNESWQACWDENSAGIDIGIGEISNTSATTR